MVFLFLHSPLYKCENLQGVGPVEITCGVCQSSVWSRLVVLVDHTWRRSSERLCCGQFLRGVSLVCGHSLWGQVWRRSSEPSGCDQFFS
jgi:hypothetical protein